MVNGSVGSQKTRHAASRYATSSVDVNDAATTSMKVASLLPRQTYRIGVAAKTRAGVGVFSEIFAKTRSFSVRKYQHYTDFNA